MARLAAIYNVWDGEELLRGSIRQIEDQVHLIIIVASEKSNTGEEYYPDLSFIKGNNKIEPIYYYYDSAISAQENEERKRNSGLEFAKVKNFTHFIAMDCDEYYYPDQFEFWKNKIINQDYDSSACQLFTYYKHPEIQLVPRETYYVPFIHKIHENTQHCFDKRYPVFADPTRRVNTYQKFLRIEEPLMHHYSFVRKDIERKWRNSSSAQAFKDISQLKKCFDAFEETGKLVFFENHSWQKVPNYFDIRVDR